MPIGRDAVGIDGTGCQHNAGSAIRLVWTRRQYSSTLTRRGLRRQTPSSRSDSPHGATIASRPSSVRCTATAVAVSGQVATPSAVLASGGTPKPKRRGYHRCTAAWFLASQRTPGSSDTSLSSTPWSRSRRRSWGQKARRRRLYSFGLEGAVELVPDQVAQRTSADPAVRCPAGACRLQHGHEPLGGPDQPLQASGLGLVGVEAHRMGPVAPRRGRTDAPSSLQPGRYADDRSD